jgi:hypothetical protein
MVVLIDILTVVVPLLLTVSLYLLYNKLVVQRYLRKMEQAIKNGEMEKAVKMKAKALKLQPRATRRFFKKHGIQSGFYNA